MMVFYSYVSTVEQKFSNEMMKYSIHITVFFSDIKVHILTSIIVPDSQFQFYIIFIIYGISDKFWYF